MSSDKKEEQKTTAPAPIPKAVALLRDFDSSGDAVIPEGEKVGKFMDSKSSLKHAESRGKRKEPYIKLIHAQTAKLKDKKRVFDYSASNRQSLKAEAINYQKFGTRSFTTNQAFAKEQGFTSTNFLYRDIEKREDNPDWPIGQSMKNANGFLDRKGREDIHQVKVSECDLDDISEVTAEKLKSDKSILLQAILENFKDQINQIEEDNNTPCPAYYSDDSLEHIKAACEYFEKNPNQIPKGVELHVTWDAQEYGAQPGQGLFVYYGIYTPDGPREPTLEEMRLRNKLLYEPQGKEVGIIEEHPLTSAILENKPSQADFKGLIEDHKEDINKEFIKRGFSDLVDTPLTLALSHKNKNAVQALLKHEKIDVNKPSATYNCSPLIKPSDCSPLTLAIINEDKDAIEALLSHPKLKLNLTEKYSPLVAALKTKNIELLKKLLADQSMDTAFVNKESLTDELLDSIEKAGAEYATLFYSLPGFKENVSKYWPPMDKRLCELMSPSPINVDTEEEQKSTTPIPKAVALLRDFDRSGDAVIPEGEKVGKFMDSNRSLERAESRGKRKKPYINFIHTQTSKLKDKKRVFDYSASLRQSLKIEVMNYQELGTRSFTTNQAFAKEQGFTSTNFLYRDIQKKRDDHGWEIGQSMQEANDFFERTDKLHEVDCSKLDDLSALEVMPGDKSILLQAILKDFKDRIDEIKEDNNTPCPAYYSDDSQPHLNAACNYFKKNPNQIPKGVELHVIWDAQADHDQPGVFVYYGIYTPDGPREPTLEEMRLRNKLLYEPQGKKVGIIEEHLLTSAILKNKLSQADFKKLIEDHKGDINEEFIKLGFSTMPNTPLTLALSHKNKNAVRALLERKEIDVNKLGSGDDKCDYPPLTLAILNEDKDAIEALLSHPKLKLHLTKDCEYSPLVAVLKTKNIELLKKLLIHPSMDTAFVNKESLTGTLLYSIETAGAEYATLFYSLPGFKENVSKYCPQENRRLCQLMSPSPIESLIQPFQKSQENALKASGPGDAKTTAALKQLGFKGIHQTPSVPGVSSSSSAGSSSSSSSSSSNTYLA